MSRSSEVPQTLRPDLIPPNIVSVYPDILDNLPHMIITYEPHKYTCYCIPEQQPAPRIILVVEPGLTRPPGEVKGSDGMNPDAKLIEGFKPHRLIRGSILNPGDFSSFFTMETYSKNIRRRAPNVDHWIEVTLVVA